MDCREFNQKHVAFVDDLLPGLDLVRMQRHLVECERCAHHDTLIRRALLVVRNMPEIRPSADFSERLQARLRTVRTEKPFEDRQIGRPRLTTFAAVATGVIAAGVLSVTVIAAGSRVARHRAAACRRVASAKSRPSRTPRPSRPAP